jgi:putative Mn2+ efflux pump MntP
MGDGNFMSTGVVFLIAIGLAMDAFAVSISEGVAIKRMHVKHAVLRGVFFGGFQALMPLIGWVLGKAVYSVVEPYKNWISFLLLAFVGAKMIFEAFEEEKCEEKGVCNLMANLTILAIATSIDALAVGFSFSFLNVGIGFAAFVIGGVTFLISFGGVYLGNKIGEHLNYKAEFLGGGILILMSLKVLFTEIIKVF